MEATTPFDLNHALAEWRNSLQQSPAFCRENLDELESHLRDSVANLQQRGLSGSEAFLIATRRVGGAPALGTEFGKINPGNVWLNRALWMLIGTLVFRFISGLVSSATMGTTVLGVVLARPVGSGVTTPLLLGTLGAFVHLLTFAAALILGWRLLVRKGNSISAWLQREPKSLARPAALVALLLIPYASAGVLQGCGMYLINKFSDGNQTTMVSAGFVVGTASAALIESAGLILLTLLLARRQLLTKI
jgi:hypothetical protein